MINGRSVLGLITARGGSKGIHRKNLRPLGGQPLLAWTVDAASASCFLDRLVLSSDDPEIIAEAESMGCDIPFVRPAHLSDDTASSVDVAIHALDQLAETYDYLVLLQPTSPLRVTRDIDECVRICHEREGTSCTSICELSTPPTWMYTVDDNQLMRPLFSYRPEPTRRQVQPNAYFSNGAVFVVNISWFRRSRCFIDKTTIAYRMPRDRSIDIDGEFDIRVAEAIICST